MTGTQGPSTTPRGSAADGMTGVWCLGRAIFRLFLAGLLSAAALCAQASPSAKSSPSAVGHASPDSGAVSNGVYRNSFFSLTCKVPYGWVDRTDAMQADDEPGKSWVLLGVFEHPPEATSDSVNSGVVIGAESLSVYPGMKSSVQYFHVLQEVTTSKDFKADGDPYEQVIGGRTLVRGDFHKQTGSVSMYQSSLALVTKGYALSFTIVAGSEDEVNALVKGLSFNVAKAPAKAGTRP